MTADGERVANAETWHAPKGSLTIEKPVRGVIRFTYHGHMVAAVVPFLEASVAEVLRSGVRPDLFIDLAAMTGYDSEYRKAISEWGARTHPHFGEVRVLVRSKLIAIGIAVSNLTAANKLKPTTDRREFERSLEAAAARHRGSDQHAADS